MMKEINLGIVGATGVVGRKILEIIEKSNIRIKELRLFASIKSQGKIIRFRGVDYIVNIVDDNSFKGLDFALFSCGSDNSKKYGLQCERDGVVVIDNSSCFRKEKDIALVVPEINYDDIKNSNRKIIANPNCSTIQCVIPLFAIEKKYHLNKIVYSTYQAVSGYGMKGLLDLEATLMGCENQYFNDSIAETCIPEIGNYCDNGFTSEENKMIDETRKILHHPNLKIASTCIRVPIKNGHGVMVYVETEEKININEIESLFLKQSGLKYLKYDNNHTYPTSILCEGNDEIYVGRLRPGGDDRSIVFYCTCDNLRKGAASNAVQILKKIISD